ncbi:MAG: hypothetical protein ISS71_04550 [Phycisphaerae bacterium]|nr:hypothetical protein [Phycisphaerae bacterium]
MKMKIDLKNSTYLVSLIAVWGGVFLVLIACYFIFDLPQKEMLAQVQRQHTESKDMLLLANKATRQDIQDQMKRHFEEVDETVRRFSVPQDNTTGVVFEIGKIANELGLSEFSSKNQRVRDLSTLGENQEVTEAWLKVEFKSSFLNFAQFVNHLESQTPTVFIEQITLRRNENDLREHDVKMELSFLVTQNQTDSVAMADLSID